MNIDLKSLFFSISENSPATISPALSDQLGKDYRICSQCVSDTSMPSIQFDENGECAYCKLQKSMEKLYPNGEEGRRILDRLVKRIRTQSKGKKYDCVIGLSGGRDSTFMLFNLVKWGLRPLAVHFNDGFGNPVAGESIQKACNKLGVDLRTITSDWRESKDLKLSFLKASTADLEQPTDLGIQTALYGTAVKEGLKFVINGHSFRTEGMAPLDWFYYDGKYLDSIHKRFGTIQRRPWKPDDPGFNLNLYHIFYYTIIKGIRVIHPLYNMDYVRTEADEILKRELDWTNPGAHYYDDLYQSLVFYVHRVKFNVDKRRFNYSALIRSGQMGRDEALKRLNDTYVIEDPKIIDLCIKRLGITKEDLDEYIARPVKTFRDYSTSYDYIKMMRIPIKIACQLDLLPKAIYSKYFETCK